MTKSKEYISGKLYAKLYELGGDSLIAFYCILKKHRKESGDSHFYSYTSRGRKIYGANIIRNKTNLSYTVIRKNLPLLIIAGVVQNTKEGHIIIHGANKLNKKLYANEKEIKHIPIITSTFKLTKLYSYFVRIHSLERKQIAAYKEKQNREEKKYKTKAEKIKAGYLEQTVLSNEGFAKYKDGVRDNKSKGNYWKRQLVSNGLLTTKRRYHQLNNINLNKPAPGERFRPSRDYIKVMLNKTLPEEYLGVVFYSPKFNGFFQELVSAFKVSKLYS